MIWFFYYWIISWLIRKKYQLLFWHMQLLWNEYFVKSNNDSAVEWLSSQWASVSRFGENGVVGYFNWKVPGLNPSRCSARLRDPPSLQGSWWLSGWNCVNAGINIRLVMLSPHEWPKVGCRTAKQQFEKKFVNQTM